MQSSEQENARLTSSRDDDGDGGSPLTGGGGRRMGRWNGGDGGPLFNRRGGVGRGRREKKEKEAN